MKGFSGGGAGARSRPLIQKGSIVAKAITAAITATTKYDSPTARLMSTVASNPVSPLPAVPNMPFTDIIFSRSAKLSVSTVTLPYSGASHMV